MLKSRLLITISDSIIFIFINSQGGGPSDAAANTSINLSAGGFHTVNGVNIGSGKFAF